MDADVIQKIKDWIGTLKGDALKGAMDAISDIIGARAPGGGAPLPPPPELPIDPELEKPEVEDPGFMDPDLEIEDPEHVLDDIDSDDSSSEADSDDDSGSSSDSDSDKSGSDKSDSDKADSDKADSDKSDSDKADKEEKSKKASEKAKDAADKAREAADKAKEAADKAKDAADSKGDSDSAKDAAEDAAKEAEKAEKAAEEAAKHAEAAAEAEAAGDEEKAADEASKAEDSAREARDAAKKAMSDAVKATSDGTESGDVDDADGVDKDLLADKETRDKIKNEVFRRKVEIASAMKQIKRIKKRIEDGKASLSNEDIAALDSLEKDLSDAFKDLKENDEEALKHKSAKEINDLINKVFDIAEKAGIKHTEINDIKARVDKMSADLEDPLTQDEFDTEDAENKVIDPEYQKMKAEEREKERLEKEIRDSWGRGFDGTMEDFKKDLLKAVSEQIADLIDVEEDTYAYPGRLHGDDYVSPATRIDEIPENKRPSIDVYFDQSGSWGEGEVKRGMAAIGELLKLKDEKLVNLEIYFFSKILSKDRTAARREGSQECWDWIIDNIEAAPKTKNVIIMTDTDIGHDYGTAGHRGCIRGKKCVVDGCVWWLWKNGDRVAEGRAALRGRQGTFEYTV